MEFLKDVLGEELYKQVAAKLTGNDKVKLANLADGQYVGKEKFDAVESTKKNLEDQIKERDKQLKALAGVDAEGMKAEIERLQSENKKAKETYETELSTRDREYAIKDYLSTSGAKNPKALKGLLDDTKIVYKGGEVMGIKEQVEALKQSDEYLFNPPAKQTVAPAGAGTATGDDVNATMNNLIRDGVRR